MTNQTSKETWPPVSVIVLTYNGERFLGDLLGSLSDQSYPADKVEIIVIDNASTDETRSIAQAHPGVRVVALERNLGFAAANNLAPLYATHDWLAFLNQDVVCHRNWLNCLVKTIMQSPDIGAVTSNMLMPGVPEFQNLDRIQPIRVLYYEDLSLFGYGRYRKNRDQERVATRIISGCSFIIRRNTIERLGYLFDEELWMYVEDTDLSLRLKNLGFRVCAVRDSVVYHLHDGSLELNSRRLKIGARAVMNRVFVFYKNMTALEFLLFLPVLFFGSPAKITELSMSLGKKIVYALPFTFFSWACMLTALTRLAGYKAKRREVLKHRRGGKLDLLRFILGSNT